MVIVVVFLIVKMEIILLIRKYIIIVFSCNVILYKKDSEWTRVIELVICRRICLVYVFFMKVKSLENNVFCVCRVLFLKLGGKYV